MELRQLRYFVRVLDLTILFDTQAARRWSVLPLVEEKLFLIQATSSTTKDGQVIKPASRASLADLKDFPLILPTGTHGLRSAGRPGGVGRLRTGAGHRAAMAGCEVDLAKKSGEISHHDS